MFSFFMLEYSVLACGPSRNSFGVAKVLAAEPAVRNTNRVRWRRFVKCAAHSAALISLDNSRVTPVPSRREKAPHRTQDSNLMDIPGC
jgi:hypothetical protein